MKKIGIIGMGYVGLPLWINFSKSGFQVVGFDAKKEIIASLNKGKSYIGHIPSSDINKAIKAGSYGTSDMSEIQNVDVIIIKDEHNLKNFFKSNLIKNEIVIGMGAGSISSWMRNLKQIL